MSNRIHWSDAAKANLRSIDREAALGILKGLARFVKTNAGDIKQLHGFSPPQYRLRIGDWRVVFRKIGEDEIEIVRVQHRKEVYR